MIINNDLLNKQKEHWDNQFLNKIDMFGNSPSIAAVKANSVFQKSKCTNLLELGAGQGRDTLFFLENNYNISALDYSNTGINQIIKKSKSFKNQKNLNAQCYDVRLKLPFEDNIFDGCFSHMLFCMAFTFKQIQSISLELLRVLKPGGINIYTVRNHSDGDFQNGKFIDKNIYQNDGFIVHFFSIKIINELSKGYKILKINDFDEGNFPRKLFLVIMKKK